MKKLYLYLHDSRNKPVSLPLLFLSFLGGWLLATGMFYFLGHGLKPGILAFFAGH